MPYLKSLRVLEDPRRNTALDVFRGLAVLSVLLFHVGLFSYGYLGVDLFFVISGFLIGGLLIEPLFAGQPIAYGRFILARGFKIWPSYFAFLIVGSAIAHFLYVGSHPSEIIPLKDWPQYIFFYRNYRGGTHWSFDHVWSLCVEEHFYLLLPVLFIWIQQRSENRGLRLARFLAFMVVAGVLGKLAGYVTGFETYAATHNRLDALAWGVLLRLGLRTGAIKPFSAVWQRILALGSSLVLLAGSALVVHSKASLFFNAVVFHSLAPIVFLVAILACVDLDFSRFRALRFVAYYSYNWYLWLPLFVTFFRDRIESPLLGLLINAGLSLALAMIFTIVVEEPMLEFRKRFLDWLSKIGLTIDERAEPKLQTKQ